MRTTFEQRRAEERNAEREALWAYIHRRTMELERDERRDKAMAAIKASLTLETVRQFLPASEITIGEHLHLKHLAVAPIVTEHRVIRQGETYCHRHEETNLPWPAERWLTHACVGCTAIAAGIAVREVFEI